MDSLRIDQDQRLRAAIEEDRQRAFYGDEYALNSPEFNLVQTESQVADFIGTIMVDAVGIGIVEGVKSPEVKLREAEPGSIEHQIGQTSLSEILTLPDNNYEQESPLNGSTHEQIALARVA